jgi:hypothetical protein
VKQRLLLCAIVAAGCVLQCEGCRMELPYAPHRDERFFVDRAVRMAASGDLNPKWFGHPGSPTLYSLILIFHVREVALHQGPLFHGTPALADEFAAHPERFYLLARYWQILFGTLALFLVHAFARRLFDARTALVATWLVATNPFVAVMCKFARTDGTSLFLAVLAALQIVRAMDRPTTRRLLFAAAAVGFAASNKYYLATYGLALFFIARPERRWRDIAMMVPVVGVTFLAATPFYLPEFAHAWRTLAIEMWPFEGPEAWSRAARHDDAAWYWWFTTAFPRLVGWAGTMVFLAGAVLLLRSRHRSRVLLLLVPLAFLVVYGLPGLRKTYWMVPIVPLFATVMAHALAQGSGKQVWRLPLLALLLSLPSLITAVRRDRVLIGPTPRYQARQWIFDHAEPGMRVVQELDSGPWMTMPPGARIDSSFLAQHGSRQVHVQVVPRLDAGGATLEHYRCDGVRYLLVNQSMVDGSGGTQRSPIHSQLAARGRLMAEFPLTEPRHDPARVEQYEIGDVYFPTVRIYDVGGLPCEEPGSNDGTR